MDVRDMGRTVDRDERRVRRRRWIRAFGTSAVVGASLWAVSPALLGHPEPWDGDFALYIACLFVAGLLSALITPRSMWGHYLGGVFGQVVYALFFPEFEPFALVGAVFVAFYSLVLWAGAAAGTAVRSSRVVLSGRA